MERPTRIVAAVAVIAVVSALGITAYAFRARLVDTPWLRGLVGSSEPSAASGDASTTTAPAAGTSAPPAADPRAEITIDPQRQQLIGVRLAPVERGALASTIRAVGTVRYDETRFADVNLKLEGWIRELYVDYTGQLVQRGQRLFTFYSPELLSTQSEYLLALKTREQLKGSQIPDARDYADRVVESARQRLLLWDLTPDQIRTLEETRQPQNAVLFTSPSPGFVIEKQALQGMHVMPGQTLYKIADLSVVWVEADIYEQDLSLVRSGQRATVMLDAYPGEQFQGRAVYIYPYVEEKTRTAKVRFELPNPRGRLKPGMYANVEVQIPAPSGLTVPSDAVLESGTQQTVFVVQGEGTFTPRQVKIGRRLGDRVEILEGLTEGEQIATGATFFLDSESQLRAGLQSYEAPPSTSTGNVRSATSLDISFRSQPDPPRTGDVTFEVTVKDAAGQPVADAEVTIALFMPAMPTMNMPAMRSETKLSPAGGGMYRGAGQVVMGGRWDVTVNVSKAGQRIGSKQFAMVAR